MDVWVLFALSIHRRQEYNLFSSFSASSTAKETARTRRHLQSIDRTRHHRRHGNFLRKYITSPISSEPCISTPKRRSYNPSRATRAYSLPPSSAFEQSVSTRLLVLPKDAYRSRTEGSRACYFTPDCYIVPRRVLPLLLITTITTK